MTPASSAEDSHKAILEDGFFVAQDPLLGQQIQKLNDDGVLFASAGGLQFCKENVLQNSRIRPVLETFFEWSCLGLYRSIGAAPGIYTFRSNPKSGVEVMLVQLWSKGSRVVYWVGSHKHFLEPIPWPNTLLRVPPARLKNLNLKPTDIITFENGGFTILDARIAFEIVEGTATTFAFGTKDAIKTWNPMILPKSQNLEPIIASMESTTLGINVAYVEDAVEHA